MRDRLYFWRSRGLVLLFVGVVVATITYEGDLLCDKVIPGFDFVGHGFDVRFEALSYQRKAPLFDFLSSYTFTQSYQVRPGGSHFCYPKQIYVHTSIEASGVTNIYTKYSEVQAFLAHSLGSEFVLGMFANSTGAGNTTLLSLNKLAFSRYQKTILYTSDSRDYRTFYNLRVVDADRWPRTQMLEDIKVATENCPYVPLNDGKRRCYLSYIDKYGTHFIRDATMGGMIEFRSSVNKTLVAAPLSLHTEKRSLGARQAVTSASLREARERQQQTPPQMSQNEFQHLVTRAFAYTKRMLSTRDDDSVTFETPTVATTQSNSQFAVLGGSLEQQAAITNAFNFIISRQSFGNVFTFSTFFLRNATENVVGDWEETLFDNPQPIFYTIEPLSTLLPLEYRAELEENIQYLLFKAAQPPEPPPFPDIISIEPPTAFNCITISWLEPIDNSALITEYIVEWDDGEYAGRGVGPDPPPLPTYSHEGIPAKRLTDTICNFVEYTRYRICVRARNKVGLSVPCLNDDGLVAIALTDPWKPSLVIYSSFVAYKRGLDITWQYPKDYGSDILYYEITLYEGPFGGILHSTIMLNRTSYVEETIHVDSLLPATIYSWLIIPFNSFGRHDDAPIRFENSTLPAEPEAPLAPTTVDTQLNNITINWKIPRQNGRPIDVYNIVALYSGGSFEFNHPLTNQNEEDFTLTGLLDSTNYNISVRAHNEIGWGEFSDPLLEVTQFPAPPEPTLETANISWYWFVVTFSGQPFVRDRPHSMTFTLRVYQGANQIDEQVLTFHPKNDPSFDPTSTFVFNVTGLSPGTLYTYTIRTSLQGAPWSTSKFTVTDPQDVTTLAATVPTKVLDFVNTQISTHILNFTWSRAHENGSPITNYRLTCNTNTASIPPAGDTLAYSLTGLDFDTTYTCFVEAENGEGFGPASDSIVVKTLFGASQMDPPIVDNPTSFSLDIHWNRNSAQLDPSLPTAGNTWLVKLVNTSVCDPFCTQTVSFSADSTSWTGLTHETFYGFQVTVSFDGGRSPPFSEISSLSTLALVTTGEVTTAQKTTSMQTTAESSTGQVTTARVTTAEQTTGT